MAAGTFLKSHCCTTAGWLPGWKELIVKHEQAASKHDVHLLWLLEYSDFHTAVSNNTLWDIRSEMSSNIDPFRSWKKLVALIYTVKCAFDRAWVRCGQAIPMEETPRVWVWPSHDANVCVGKNTFKTGWCIWSCVAYLEKKTGQLEVHLFS